MGMAYQAPLTKREFRYQITKHAIDRFRERVEEEFSHRDDIDLARLLDDRLRAAVDGGNYTDILDNSSPNGEARVARIESRVGTTQHVVLRPDKNVVSGYAAVTVISDAQARNNYATGTWRVPNRPFAEALRNVRPAPPATAKKPEAPVVHLAPPAEASTEEREPRWPRGAKSSESTRLRIAYVREVLRERPGIDWGGADGINLLVKKRYGIGISHQVFVGLRDAMQGSGERAPTPAVVQALPPPITAGASADERSLRGRAGC